MQMTPYATRVALLQVRYDHGTVRCGCLLSLVDFGLWAFCDLGLGLVFVGLLVVVLTGYMGKRVEFK